MNLHLRLSTNFSLISLFNNNWRYLDDILIVKSPNFITFVKHIYHLELTLDNNQIVNFVFDNFMWQSGIQGKK
jgi:hypothetical protein